MSINYRNKQKYLFKAVTDVVKYKLSFAEVEQGRPATVKDAAMCFKDIVYEYRDSLMAGLIVAGFDKVGSWHLMIILRTFSYPIFR